MNYRSPFDGNAEFIELYNNESEAVDLSGWSLTNSVDYTFGAGTSIPANGFIVVAADPAYISANFFQTALGPFKGKLSNSSDKTELLDQNCVLIHHMKYESWDEWPSVRNYDNGLYTFELIDTTANGWDGAFIEIILDGISQGTYTVQSSTNVFTLSIAHETIVEVKYTGGNSNNENSYDIIDPSGAVIYSAGLNPTSGTSFVSEGIDKYVSIQKINPLLPGNQPGSWAGSYPTPATQNYSVYIANSTNVAVLKNVSKSPDKPIDGEDVRIKADFSMDDDVFQGALTVTLEYQINEAGNYKHKNEIAWTAIPMLDDGMGPDSTADNGVYTTIIPGSLNKHRSLVRFRVVASNGMGPDRIFPDPKFKEFNYSYFVYDGFPTVHGQDLNAMNELQDIMFITNSETSSFYIGNKNGVNNYSNHYQGQELLGRGTLVYKGKVFDHINFRPRGKGSRTERTKPGIKIGLNKENPITFEDDCGKSYDEARTKVVLSGTWVNDLASHGLTESIVYKVSELAGGLPRYTDYAQVYVIDNSVETGNAVGDFFGVFLILEDYNGDYLAEHEFAEGNFWNTNRATRHRELDYEGDFAGAESVPNFAPFDMIRGSFTVNELGNKPLLFGDRIAAEVYGLNGNNYIGKHSYNEYYDSATQSYLGWWGDMDNTFGSPYDDVTVFPRVDSKIDAINAGNMIIPASMQTEFQNEFRSVYDLLLDYNDPDCNCYQSDYLVDQESKKIFSAGAGPHWTDVDKSRWGQNYDLGNYASQQNWYKTWFQNRKPFLVNHFEDIDIPTKPTITAPNSTALDELIYTNSAFSDLQGAGSFDALEWRVGEWSDPSNSFYDQECEAIYEIETKWRSGEIGNFTSSFQIPPEAKLKEDRTYLIRVRYKDDTGKWSHWSDPHKLVPTPAANPIDYGLVINEIMYNPARPTRAEFIEIFNSQSTTVSLDHVQFNEGIDFEFEAGSSIASESYICIAKDSFEFFKAYGYYPFGEYKGGLDNSGELLRLVGEYRTLIDTVRYNDKAPWPSTPDKGLYSLALKSPSLPNEEATNWDIQSMFVTPCQENEFNNLGAHPFSGIVINEIHYNPHDEIDDAGNVTESGTKFEFVELKNITTTPINMTGVLFTRGIEYAFEDGTMINPGEFFVLAEDKSSFLSRYGIEADDKYDGKLSNNGETLWLAQSSGLLMDAVTYGVSFPWDGNANGGQEDLSLALIDGAVDNDTRLNWTTQCTHGFTPGAENDFECFTGLNYEGLTINEIHYNPAGGSSLEYVEIINNSNSVLNLEEVALVGGVVYIFDAIFMPPKIAAPNNHIIIAKDAVAFQNAFGFAPLGEYTGVLSNNGETLILQDLFEAEIDRVNYQNMIITNPLASQGNHSIALLDPDLDNNVADSWCTQDVSLSPKSVNSFSDADGDAVLDCLDQCPGMNDDLIGTACEDGDPCTTGESFDSNCNCTGGVFIDSDNDSVCDINDLCPGSDDTIDLDNNGIPDGCEECVDVIIENTNPIISVDQSADISITTNGKANTNSTVDYSAGEFLEFAPGFEVEAGSVFHAFISPCN